jgi:hypothetical protein
MKTKPLQGLIATLLLVCGLTKVSAAIDPSILATQKIEPVVMQGEPPCILACTTVSN